MAKGESIAMAWLSLAAWRKHQWRRNRSQLAKAPGNQCYQLSWRKSYEKPMWQRIKREINVA
jgi:hypothetical protein